MKVRIVINQQNTSWILGKMGRRLDCELKKLGINSEIGEEASSAVDINHWMSYVFATGCLNAVNTMMITHIDDAYKVNLVAKKLKKEIDLGICMSADMRSSLISKGISEERLSYVLPAFEVDAEVPRIIIGIATRLYQDGRKREALLEQLAKEISLDNFHFKIFGTGWDKVIKALLAAGATVDYRADSNDMDLDYKALLRGLRESDYYLYLGLDEGALGTLDAIASGAKIITTPQGFHLDLPTKLINYFLTYEDLKEVFQQISNTRNDRLHVVNEWTWENYATEHAETWQLLLSGKANAINQHVTNIERYRNNSNKDEYRSELVEIEKRNAIRNLFKWKRIIGAISRMKILLSIRKYLNI